MYGRSASYARSAVTWLVGSGLVTAVACGGSAFSDDGGTAGSSAEAGASANASGGAGPHEVGGAGSPNESAAGTSASGSGEGGEPSYSQAGAAGAGGAPLSLVCSERHGHTFAEHCYLDVTVESVNQIDAAAACLGLASETGS